MSKPTVSLIQAAPHWHDAAANRELFEGLLQQVPDASSLVVLPEMFSTGFTMATAEQAEPMNGPTINWLRSLAKDTEKTLCGSLAMVESNGRHVNRLLWVPPCGELTYYDKRHCFRLAGEHEHYMPGRQRVVVEHHGAKVLLQICYDLRFPVFARNRQDYDIYLNVANWPEARQSHWNTLLRARAIENQCFVLAVNRVGSDGNGLNYIGGSGIYDYRGEAVEVLFDQPGIISVQLDLDALGQWRRDLPFWQDADGFDLKD